MRVKEVAVMNTVIIHHKGDEEGPFFICLVWVSQQTPTLEERAGLS